MILAALSTAALLGGVVCAEARGLPRREQLAVAQVALNLARAERTTLARVLRAPGRWASPDACPRALRPRFAALARAFLAGRLHAPRWARKALAFVAPRALAKVRARWRARGFRPLVGTGTVHTFWQRAGPRRPARATPRLASRAPATGAGSP